MSNEDIQYISVYIDIRMLMPFVIRYFVFVFFLLVIMFTSMSFGMLVLISSWTFFSLYGYDHKQ